MGTDKVKEPMPKPSWACPGYGHWGHDFNTCTGCTSNKIIYDRKLNTTTPEIEAITLLSDWASLSSTDAKLRSAILLVVGSLCDLKNLHNTPVGIFITPSQAKNIAGDNLCRLSDTEIADMQSGKVKIPPEKEFLESCRRFHNQIANECGELGSECMTIAQLEKSLAECKEEGKKDYAGMRYMQNKFIKADSELRQLKSSILKLIKDKNE